MNNIYNKMQQPIMYRGQLVLRDIVYRYAEGLVRIERTITNRNGNTGVMTTGTSKIPIWFIEGKGWCWGVKDYLEDILVEEEAN